MTSNSLLLSDEEGFLKSSIAWAVIKTNWLLPMKGMKTIYFEESQYLPLEHIFIISLHHT